MRIRRVIPFFLVSIFAIAPAASFANGTPSPQVSLSPKHVLSQVQKDAISAARTVFAKAKLNARDGFDRALADAQAVRDQAILEAGTNPADIRAAKKIFSESYKTIYRAYIADLNSAKSILQASIAAAKAAK